MLTDNTFLIDYPIELWKGIKILQNNIVQYTFETIVITIKECLR